MTGEPLILRAHQVLCLQGFQGAGYSPEFVAEMDRVHKLLAQRPDQSVRLTQAPDRLCRSCPHLADAGCTLQGPEHEAHMRAHDGAVLERLGLTPGVAYPWQGVLERIRATTRGADLPGICTTCPWLDRGWCARAVDALAGGSRPGR